MLGLALGMSFPVQVSPPVSASAVAAPERSIAATPSRLPFEFTGSAREYFGIWIVNVLLTVLTLGVYSAWAKVRTRQYFYRHTWLAGSSFEYDADARRILCGRVLVLVLILALFVARHVAVVAALVVFLLTLVVTPWLLAKSLAFNARYSSYRNVRFAFEGTTRQAYAAGLRALLTYVLTCGVGYPHVRYLLLRYSLANHRFGKQRFSWAAGSGDFFGIYVAAVAVAIAAFVCVLAGLAVADVSALEGPKSSGWMRLSIYAALVPFVAVVHAGVTNLKYDDLWLGGFRFSSQVSAWKLLALYLGNLLAILLSLGLLVPWARIRMARYRSSCTAVWCAGGLAFEGLGEEPEASVLADAAVDTAGIDLDVGF